MVAQAMEYEYVLYKPPELWPKLRYRLGTRDFVQILGACGTMRAAVEAMGVPTDLSGEHFLTMRACGDEGAEGARAFKRETLAAIVSCDYRRLDALCARTNAASARLAGRALRQEEAGSLMRRCRNWSTKNRWLADRRERLPPNRRWGWSSLSAAGSGPTMP